MASVAADSTTKGGDGAPSTEQKRNQNSVAHQNLDAGQKSVRDALSANFAQNAYVTSTTGGDRGLAIGFVSQAIVCL